MTETDCIFCKIATGELPTDKIYEDDYALAFRDLHPQAPVHLLVIPKDHLESLNDVSPSDEKVLGHLMRLASRIANQLGIAESGFRTVVNTGPDGGQSVFHLHVHLLGGRPLTWPPG